MRPVVPLLLLAVGAAAVDVPAGTAGPAPAIERISVYEPSWFLVDPGWETDRPVTAKFQISFAVRLVSEPGAVPAAGDLRCDGLYASYSQTSLWDLSSLSKPFIDSSYRPEIWWHQQLGPARAWGLDALEGGFAHESNGKEGPDSRSINRLFLRPMGHWDLGDGWLLRATPRAGIYVGDMSDNPDMARYRGYFDLDAGIGRPDGCWAALRGRIGDDWDKGSLQVSLDYPLESLTGGWVQGYAMVQYFLGYSESLIDYDQRVEQPRLMFGFAITR